MISNDNNAGAVVAAAGFLELHRPGGPWTVAAIVPDGRAAARTYSDAQFAARWALDRNAAGANAYFVVNRTTDAYNAAHLDQDHDGSPPEKAEMLAMDHFYVDVDPRVGEDFAAERARILALMTTRLPSGVPAPSCILSSGGGFQSMWQLVEPILIDGLGDLAAEAERYNRALEALFGADSCHNCNRLLRLGGTKNWPTKRKLAKGRSAIPTEAEVYDRPGGGRAYELSAFRLNLPPPKGVSVPAMASKAASRGMFLAVGPQVGVDELEAWALANGKTIEPRTLAVIATGEHPTDAGRYGADRSDGVFAVTCDLVRAGVPDELIVGALIFSDNRISAHVLAQNGNTTQYAQRQVDRARKEVAAELAGPRWDRVDKEGSPVCSFPNTVTALRLMGLDCSYDVFRGRNLVGMHELQEFAGEFSDQAESLLRREVRLRYGFDPAKDNVKDAVLELCALNRFDSLIDHLNTLPAWDGVPRVDTWLPTFLGAEDSAYTRGAGATWLLAAVARAFEPGAKFDHMLVLVGAQGVGKSTALRLIAGEEFFSDANFLNAKDSREVLEATAGAWIVECAELAGMRKKDTETLKYEITKQHDKGRHAFARHVVNVGRRFVLAGTTNSARFLQDETGNRRFWPVEVAKVDLPALGAARAQLLAEALVRYRSATYKLFLTDAAAVGAECAQHSRRAVEIGYVEQLECLPWRQTLKGRPAVTTDDVYGFLNIPRERRQGQTATNVCRAMESLGWKKSDAPVRLDDEPANKRRAYVWNGEGQPSCFRSAVAETDGVAAELPF